MYTTIIVPRILAPQKVRKIKMPESYLINKKIFKEEPKKLLVAAGAGGVPPKNPNNLPSIKKEWTPAFLKKVREITKDTNKFIKKEFDIFNRY